MMSEIYRHAIYKVIKTEPSFIIYHGGLQVIIGPFLGLVVSSFCISKNVTPLFKLLQQLSSEVDTK